MKKVLCPVNFTNTALNALEYACSLANVHQSSLTLFHVITDEEYNSMLENEEESVSNYFTKEKKELEDKLESLCREAVQSYPDLQCTWDFGYGSLTKAIVEFAEKKRFQLIVMGNDGVTDVTESFNGSSTIKVIEKALCPVLSVPYQAEFQGFQKVLYGTEFREADRDALIQLHLLLEPLERSIEVVHLYKKEGKGQKNALQKKMDNLKTYLDIPSLNYRIREHKNSIRLALDECMEESEAELLVLLTHRHNYFERVFQKSVSRGISYFADYPLLIFLEDNLRKE